MDTEDVNTILEFTNMKQKFHDEAAKAYPNTGQPEMCWLFDQVLGIDPRLIAAEPITKKTYKAFIMKGDNTKLPNPKTKASFVVTRKFTPQQQKALREWWIILPEEMKA